MSDVLEEVRRELLAAQNKFSPFATAHHGYAVLLEEVDELWDAVKTNPRRIALPPDIVVRVEDGEVLSEDEILNRQKQEHVRRMRREAIQVAAMALRFVRCLDEGFERE